jgi:hypothetical protein
MRTKRFQSTLHDLVLRHGSLRQLRSWYHGARFWLFLAARHATNVPIGTLNEIFASDFVDLPTNMIAFGYSDDRLVLSAHSSDLRITSFLSYWDDHVHPALGVPRYCFAMCFGDGYRERVAPTPSAPRQFFRPEPHQYTHLRDIDGDANTIPILYGGVHVLTFSKRINDDTAVCVPDFHYLGSKGYRDLTKRIDTHRIPWNEKHPMAVFRGRLSHGRPSTFPGCETPMTHREHLFHLTRTSDLGDLLDYEKDYMSIEDMARHKYLVDADGFTNSWDGLFWKLSSGSVVLKHESPWKQWYYDDLVAWKHYIPVANDFSDLGEKIRWCHRHDDECREIGQNAREFVLSTLSWNRVRDTTIQSTKRLLDSSPHPALAQQPDRID